MNIRNLCHPALVHLIFSIAQVVLDMAKGMFNIALVKLIITVMISLLLNYLCDNGMTIVAWFIVAVPFILMTVVTSILIYGIGVYPKKPYLELKYSNHEPEVDMRREYTNLYPPPTNIPCSTDIHHTDRIQLKHKHISQSKDTHIDTERIQSSGKYKSCSVDSSKQAYLNTSSIKTT